MTERDAAVTRDSGARQGESREEISHFSSSVFKSFASSSHGPNPTRRQSLGEL